MPERKNIKYIKGVIDPISIIGVLFLIVTLVVGTKVTNDRNFSLNIAEKAWIPKEADLNKNSSLIGDNKNNSVKTNKNDEDDEEPAQQQVVAPEATPPFKTCDANGTKYSPGAVVMYGGIGSNATCGEDGKWNVGVGATKDIKPENLPEYAKGSDKLKKQIESEEAVAETEKVIIPPQNPIQQQEQQPTVTYTEKTQKDDVSVVPQIQPSTPQYSGETREDKIAVAQPVNTTPTSSLADITAGVTSGTIPSSSKPYVPPLLPTVPTAEDLLRKLPGLENLNINNIKNFNYPTSPQEENKKIFNWPKLEGLGTYGLGGGNAYVAPVPQNIIKSQNNSDLYNYMLGNTISAGAGFASATLVTPGAPAFVFETITAVPGAIKALTLSDLADTAVTGAMCAQGNQEACAAFTATALIPGPTGSVNLITDSIEDFATSWAGTGSVVNKIINNIPSQAVPNADEILNAMAPHAPIGNPVPKTLDNPLTSVVDNSFVKNLPSDFQVEPNIVDFTNSNSIPPATEIKIPQKFTNWVKDEIAKTNPNAFNNIKTTLTNTLDNFKNGFGEKITKPVQDLALQQAKDRAALRYAKEISGGEDIPLDVAKILYNGENYKWESQMGSLENISVTTTINTKDIYSIDSDNFPWNGDPNHMSIQEARELYKSGNFDPIKSNKDPIKGYQLINGEVHIISGRHRATAALLENQTEIPIELYKLKDQESIVVTPTIPPPPVTILAKVQDGVGTVVKNVLNGSVPTGVGFSPLKYVAGGIASAVFLDDYFDLGITDSVLNNITDTVYSTANFGQLVHLLFMRLITIKNYPRYQLIIPINAHTIK